MSRLRTLFLLALGLAVMPWALHAQQMSEWVIEPLTPEAEVEYDFQTDVATATNGVIVKYAGAVLTAERVAVSQSSGEVVADGSVRIQQGEQIWVSEHMRYNFKTRQMQSEQFRTGKTPIFAAGQNLHGDITNRVYVASDALITADDSSHPLLKVRAKSIRILPGERIQARHATLYVGQVPVFYFPYYSRALGPRANEFNVLPGYRSRFGPFALGSYTWILNEQLDGVAHVDYRERRGVGVGPDFNYHLGQWGDGTLRYYYTHDERPNQDLPPGAQPVPEDRQRLYFAYQADPATNLNVKALVRYQTDWSVVRDFFEGEYRQNPQPSTFFEVNKLWPNFSLDAYAQPRVNDFLETVERLPDVRLTGFRQQVAGTPVYYESESSAGYYRRLFPYTNGIPFEARFAAARADTYHQVLLPETLFGWLNITPRAGGRFTYYSEASGPGATTDELYRGIFNTGAEVNFKASRLWPGAQSRFLEADGLRHIIEPSVNYVYVPRPNYRPGELPQFDYELPSLRLLPIEFPDFNAVDSIDSQNVLRLGLRNRLQTKRQGQLVNLLSWDVYADWRLRPRADQSSLSDIFSDVTIRPRSWLTLESLTRYNVSDGQFRLSFHTVSIQPSDVWSWSVSHYYLRSDSRPPPLGWGEGNNLILSSMFFRLNENWGFRTAQHFEARDGRMEEQSYSIYRDLRSWTAALSFRIRDNRTGPDDYTVAFTFSLKSFPRYGLGNDAIRPYWLLGG